MKQLNNFYSNNKLKIEKMKKTILLAIIAISVLHVQCSAQQPQLSSDVTIYVNGVVITVDSDVPYAEAFAVVNGRFAAVGTNAEIRRMATSSTKVVDLKGMTVTPGFNDTHVHSGPVYNEDSPYYIPWLGPEKVSNMDDLIAELKKLADRTPPGQLVRGVRYQDSKLGRHPTRWDLDKVSTVHPIRITHSSGHVSVVNSYILEASGITKNHVDPTGNSFDRDPDGTPNGVLRAGARVLTFTNDMQIPYEAQLQGLINCFHNYAKLGITSVGIAGGNAEAFKMHVDVRDAGSPVRMAFMYREVQNELKDLGIKAGFGDDRLRLSHIKFNHGNSMSGNTCWLSEPYLHRPDYYGIPPSRSQESLNSVIQEIHDAGFPVAVHSNGDREIDMTLTAIERAQANNPRPDARHRIEHASVMTMPLLERAKKAGVILVFHSYMYEHGDKLEVYGEQRLEMVHPYRTAIDMDVLVAGHSDSPIAKADAMLVLHDMVNRRGENGKLYGGSQRITVEEAIKVWTIDGAFTTFEEDIKGSITPGKLADFIVLRQDPRKVDPNTIKDIVVDATYIGGVNVWQAND